MVLFHTTSQIRCFPTSSKATQARAAEPIAGRHQQQSRARLKSRKEVLTQAKPFAASQASSARSKIFEMLLCPAAGLHAEDERPHHVDGSYL